MAKGEETNRRAYGKAGGGRELKFNSSQGKSFPATCYSFSLYEKELGYFGIHLKTSELNDF